MNRFFLFFFSFILFLLNYYYQKNYSFSNREKITKEIDLINLIEIVNNPTNYLQKKNISDIKILLTIKEKVFFSLILTKCKKYLEFGVGGSTLLAYTTQNIKKIISVDSDIKWINEIKKFKNIKNDENKKIIFEYIDIGEISNLGYPKIKTEKMFNYSNQVFKKYKNEYDLVFIDGRFRVACTLQVILNCKKDIKILIHDFNKRSQYHILYKYLDVIYSINNLVLFSIKERININEVIKNYEIYKSIPD